ncbi:MAG TPA: hypothetical protein VHU23_16960 [Rhizomicrobium sp.]|jgi:hypothetical protein|nr:hypothetical protein [Rhizomicrobium sp.]
MRAVILPVLIILSGPRVVLLMPVWLLGCAIYFANRHFTIPRPVAPGFFLASILALVLIRASGIDDAVDSHVTPLVGRFLILGTSRQFASQYLVAVFVAVNFLAASNCRFEWLNKETIARFIPYAASFTFALYLMHRPLLDFYSFVFHQTRIPCRAYCFS